MGDNCNNDYDGHEVVMKMMIVMIMVMMIM